IARPRTRRGRDGGQQRQGIEVGLALDGHAVAQDQPVARAPAERATRQGPAEGELDVEAVLARRPALDLSMQVGDEREQRCNELLGKGSMTDDGGQLRLDEPYVGREQRAKVLDEGIRTCRGAPALREAGDPFLGSAVRSGGWGGRRAGCAHLVTLLAVVLERGPSRAALQCRYRRYTYKQYVSIIQTVWMSNWRRGRRARRLERSRPSSPRRRGQR